MPVLNHRTDEILETTMNHEGSCLCGSVRWRVDGELSSVSHCHCSMCRKAHGTAFGTYAVASRSALRWLSGESAVTRYASSPGTERGFCSRCGSVVPEDYGDTLVFVPLGCLDDNQVPVPTEHIFVGSRARWHTITDALAQHDAYPPGVDARPVAPANGADGPAARPGALRGSCLCRKIAFEVAVPLQRINHCHCSRCRRGRSAAHATNGYTLADGVLFTRGEGALRQFNVPDAEFFTQVFCAGCGSPMPQIYRDRDLAVIPLGALDDDPGRPPDAHIFVASKAPWFTITDDVPQFSERS